MNILSSMIFSLAFVFMTAVPAFSQDPAPGEVNMGVRVLFAEPELLVIKTSDKNHEFKVELADTPARQEQGLMYRKSLADDAGMLFMYDPPRPVFMWMKNTFVSLDMLFLSPKGRILKIARQTRPHSERLVSSGGQVAAVLEIKGGRAQALGLRPGDKVFYPFFLPSQKTSP